MSTIEKGKLGIYQVVYSKLEELNGIKLDNNTDPEKISAVVDAISSLAYVLAEGKRMRDSGIKEKE